LDVTFQVNIAEAKAKLSSLLDRALTGEEVVIARAGKPLVRLVPVNRREKRKAGAWRGWAAHIPTEAFLAPMDTEDLDAAEGKHTDEFGISSPKP
jgi:prevent-host-death family protein